MKKDYQTPYFSPRFVRAIKPLMTSGPLKETGTGYEGGFGEFEPGDDDTGA